MTIQIAINLPVVFAHDKAGEQARDEKGSPLKALHAEPWVGGRVKIVVPGHVSFVLETCYLEQLLRICEASKR